MITNLIDIILSIILTWGVGLLPAYLLRFKLYNKPLKKRFAIPFVITVLFFHLVLAIAIKDMTKVEQGSHSALGLVALVSYFLLTKKQKKISEK